MSEQSIDIDQNTICEVTDEQSLTKLKRNLIVEGTSSLHIFISRIVTPMETLPPGVLSHQDLDAQVVQRFISGDNVQNAVDAGNLHIGVYEIKTLTFNGKTNCKSIEVVEYRFAANGTHEDFTITFIK